VRAGKPLNMKFPSLTGGGRRGKGSTEELGRNLAPSQPITTPGRGGQVRRPRKTPPPPPPSCETLPA
jgi:hypothetical protein